VVALLIISPTLSFTSRHRHTQAFTKNGCTGRSRNFQKGAELGGRGSRSPPVEYRDKPPIGAQRPEAEAQFLISVEYFNVLVKKI